MGMWVGFIRLSLFLSLSLCLSMCLCVSTFQYLTPSVYLSRTLLLSSSRFILSPRNRLLLRHLPQLAPDLVNVSAYLVHGVRRGLQRGVVWVRGLHLTH